jgi:hypothetical protein
METPPARMMISAMADAKIGRVMKKFTRTLRHVADHVSLYTLAVGENL